MENLRSEVAPPRSCGERVREQGQFGSCHILVNEDSVPRQSLPRWSLLFRNMKSRDERTDGWTDSRTTSRCVKEKYNHQRRSQTASLAPVYTSICETPVPPAKFVAVQCPLLSNWAQVSSQQ